MAGDNKRRPGPRETLSGSEETVNAVKLTINDAVFEVLEAVSGKSVGTALVRVGWGPESFDSVFSVGDFLICVRDGARITVYSMSTGQIQSRLFGRYVAASAETGLLAAGDGNHLRLYDPKTGTNKDEYIFSEAPVYTHFSRDGKRLLVLTADQSIFVMDVTSFTDSNVSQSNIR